MKTNSGKKGAGMPVVRNPQFNFREGFCWIDVNSTYLKARLKNNGIFDVLSMSLFTMTKVPDWYYVSIINSDLISLYVDNFINNTSHFQINDARQLPIIIPSGKQLDHFHDIFRNAVDIKKKFFKREIDYETAEQLLSEVQKQLNQAVQELYLI